MMMNSQTQSVIAGEVAKEDEQKMQPIVVPITALIAMHKRFIERISLW
jgi:hypothetical protein